MANWLQRQVNQLIGSLLNDGKKTAKGRRPRRRPSSSRHRNNKGSAKKRNAKNPSGANKRKTTSRTSKKNQSKSKKTILAYHGTSASSAADICRRGWVVGSGNALGDGVYFATDVATAKSYAGSGGIYIKCLISGRICYWDSATQAKFSKWCSQHNVTGDNSARTAYLLKNGFKTLVSGNVLVVLSPQYANGTAWKQRMQGRIRILGVFQASNDNRIRV